MRRLILSVATILSVVGTAGCADDLTGVSADPAGTYRLISVNGSLPYVIPASSGGPITYVGGELELSDRGDFHRTYQLSRASGTVDFHVFGSWNRVGNSIRLEANDGRIVWARFRADIEAIVLRDETDAEWRYER